MLQSNDNDPSLPSDKNGPTSGKTCVELDAFWAKAIQVALDICGLVGLVIIVNNQIKISCTDIEPNNWNLSVFPIIWSALLGYVAFRQINLGNCQWQVPGKAIVFFLMALLVSLPATCSTASSAPARSVISLEDVLGLKELIDDGALPSVSKTSEKSTTKLEDVISYRGEHEPSLEVISMYLELDKQIRLLANSNSLPFKLALNEILPMLAAKKAITLSEYTLIHETADMCKKCLNGCKISDSAARTLVEKVGNPLLNCLKIQSENAVKSTMDKSTK